MTTLVSISTLFCSEFGRIMIRSFMIFSILLSFQFMPAAYAASLGVSPVSLDLAANRRSATVRVENLGRSKASLQARMMKWTQVDGKNVLQPTQNVVVSPPLASIEPGVTYTFRILHKGKPTSGEETYRLLIDELPSVNVGRPSTSISMLVQQSIPVFFNNPDTLAKLTWDIKKTKNGYQLSATNSGNRHSKIADIKINNKLVKRGMAGYLLPGTTRTWPMAGSSFSKLKPGSTVTVTASGSDYGVKTDVTVGG
ncbi:fimbria/pilus periplasmic chaperone [Mesorhizobium sp. NBSH29]|uniref:fimbrial biogenesis chaperone n=1 Tax=Mesorhizobium sp. NBSH29 TaxID=2654249 RepID=UPI00189668B1|nr:molecular chaperone [Mesorhizobium sp. NBSH29]QPC85450.1 fimbria/pilus periplasmic chaperone [Mesorhizobium sp. NBSH29]